MSDSEPEGFVDSESDNYEATDNSSESEAASDLKMAWIM